jgi:sulfide:quinone oxidoreductase
VHPGQLLLRPGNERVDVRRIVALPVLEGPQIPGVPVSDHGFIPTDEHGRVRGLTDVYAAGDAADFPVKQGGLACQQADAIAEYLAAQAGADIQPTPFRPVLRGKLLTGRAGWFLRNALHGGGGEGRASDLAMWFPPTKVSGKYLSQWLPHLDREVAPPAADEPHVDIEVPLPSPHPLGWEAMRLDPYSPVHHHQG